MDAAYRSWSDSKKSGEYGDLFGDLPDDDCAVVLWLAVSGDYSFYTAEARDAMVEFLSLQKGLRPFRVEFHPKLSHFWSEPLKQDQRETSD